MGPLACYFSLYEVIHLAQLFQSRGVLIHFLFLKAQSNLLHWHLLVAPSRWKSLKKAAQQKRAKDI